jgi:hypothetical protein
MVANPAQILAAVLHARSLAAPPLDTPAAQLPVAATSSSINHASLQRSSSGRSAMILAAVAHARSLAPAAPAAATSDPVMIAPQTVQSFVQPLQSRPPPSALFAALAHARSLAPEPAPAPAFDGEREESARYF